MGTTLAKLHLHQRLSGAAAGLIIAAMGAVVLWRLAPPPLQAVVVLVAPIAIKDCWMTTESHSERIRFIKEHHFVARGKN